MQRSWSDDAQRDPRAYNLEPKVEVRKLKEDYVANVGGIKLVVPLRKVAFALVPKSNWLSHAI